MPQAVVQSVDRSEFGTLLELKPCLTLVRNTEWVASVCPRLMFWFETTLLTRVWFTDSVMFCPILLARWVYTEEELELRESSI